MPAAARRALPARLLPGALVAALAVLLLSAAPALAQDPLPVIRLFIQAIPDHVPHDGDRYEAHESFTTLEGDRDSSIGLDTRFKLRYRVHSNINTSVGVRVRRQRDDAAGKMGFNSNTSTLNFSDNQVSSGQSQFTQSDYTAEEDGVVTLSIFADDSKYTLGTPSFTTITILDDDTVFTVSSQQTHITEGDTVTFTVTPDPSPSKVARTVGVDLVTSRDLSINGPTFREVEFGVGTSSATFTVETRGDNIALAAGEIRAEVRSGAWKVGAPASVTVLDDVIEMSISAPETVREGEPAVFTITPNSLSLSAHTVKVRLNPGGDQNLTLPPLTESVTLSVNTTEGTGDSTLIAFLLDGDTYTATTPAVASVTVLDDDLTLTLSASQSSLTEGDTVMFTVTANPAPQAERTVPVSVSVNENFALVGSADANMKTLATEVTLTAGQTEATFSVQVEDDARDSLRGELQAQIQSGPWTVGAPSPLTLPVDDNDIPTITISAPESVVGSAAIRYTLIATPAPATDIRVGLGYAPFAGGTTRTIPAGDSTYEDTYPFTSPDADNTSARDTTITVTVGSGNGYAVGDPSSASITVLDDDTTLTISSQATSVIEGGAAVEFTLTPEPSPMTNTRTVEVDLTVTGDFALVGDALRPVEFARGATSATFSVEIEGDDAFDMPGELRAEIRSGAWKTTNESRSETVAILDPTPVVTIAPPAAPISEGATAVFTLNLLPAPTSSLSVSVEHSGGGGSLPVETGATTRTFNVTTSNSAGDSTVTATVQAGTGYVVGAESTATAEVLDNDAVMSIRASQTSIAEGDSVEFTVTADPPPPSPRTVAVNVAVTGEFEIDGGVTSHALELTTATPTAMFMVTIGDDDEGESSGTLTATLPSGPGYQLGTASVMVILNSNDGNPDVNASGSVTALDALILYYAYVFRSDLGTGN